MSWQAYVDTQLVGTGDVSQAAILGHDGATWAASSGFNVSKEEGIALRNGFDDPTPLLEKGIFIAKEKYMTLRTSETSIYGKLKSSGCVCVKTNQCIIIGLYTEPTQPGQCTTIVEKLGDYLRDNGY